jgi:hypothetical protein
VTGEIIAPVSRSRLVRYVETFSEHRYGRWVLAAIAFADSSFLPIPPDLLLVPMALVRLKQIWSLSLVCAVASSLGAVVGYVIGYGLWGLIGARLVELYGCGEGFIAYQHLIEKWGVSASQSGRRSAPPLFGHALAARAPHGRAYRPFQCRFRRPEPGVGPWRVTRSQSPALIVSDELPRSP